MVWPESENEAAVKRLAFSAGKIPGPNPVVQKSKISPGPSSLLQVIRSKVYKALLALSYCMHLIMG